MKESRANPHEGKVVSMTGNKLVTKCPEGKEHSHTLAADAKVICHGKTSKAEDLKPGMTVRVTTLKDDKNVATGIECTDKKQACANTHEGKIISLTGNKLVTTCSKGKEHFHTVAGDAKVSGHAKVSQLRDLKPGMQVRVTTKPHDINVATGIELAQSV